MKKTLIPILALLLGTALTGNHTASAQRHGHANHRTRMASDNRASRDDDREDERQITFSALPQAAQTFVKNYFNTSDISFIKEDTDKMYKEYKVYMKDGSRMEFDTDGQWTEIKLRSKDVPKEVVPESVTAYIIESYPQHTIMTIERHGRGYEVELSNGIEIKFNQRGEMVRID